MVKLIGIIFVIISVGAGIGGLIYRKGKDAGPLAPDPALPAASASAARIEALQRYYREDSKRCPQLRIDPALEREFPQIRQTLAVLKYVLEQDDIDLRPTTEKFYVQPPKYPLDQEHEKRVRYRVRTSLNDPALMLTFDPALVPIDQEIAARMRYGVRAAQTKSGTEIGLTHFAGGTSPGATGQPPAGHPLRNSFRLAHTILHELVHVDQVRHEGGNPGRATQQEETPAYAWEHALPEELKSLFHLDTLAKLQPLCGGTTPSTPPGGQRGQVPSPTPGPDCTTRIAESVKKAIPSLPLYAQSKTAGQPITRPLESSYDMEQATGATSVSTGPKQNIVFGTSWNVKTTCATPRTAQQQQAAFAAVKDPCGAARADTTITLGAFGPNSCVAVRSEPGAMDPNFSGDPYSSSGIAYIATACGDIWVRTGISVFADGSHGARNKPDVLATLKSDAGKWIHDAAPKILAAVNQACGRTPA